MKLFKFNFLTEKKKIAIIFSSFVLYLLCLTLLFPNSTITPAIVFLIYFLIILVCIFVYLFLIKQKFEVDNKFFSFLLTLLVYLLSTITFSAFIYCSISNITNKASIVTLFTLTLIFLIRLLKSKLLKEFELKEEKEISEGIVGFLIGLTLIGALKVAISGGFQYFTFLEVSIHPLNIPYLWVFTLSITFIFSLFDYLLNNYSSK